MNGENDVVAIAIGLVGAITQVAQLLMMYHFMEDDVNQIAPLFVSL